jgi:hypothetical protein
MTLDHALRTANPQLTANVRLYSAGEGGKQQSISLGFECLCTASNKTPPEGFHAFPLLLDGPLAPGDTRRLGFLFLNEEGAEALGRHGRFYLFEGDHLFGEAAVA